MHLIDVFYYYEYLFYKKLIKDPDPHFAALLGLSLSQSLIINAIINFVSLKFFCFQIKILFFISIVLIIIYLNYLFYHKSGKAKIIVKAKPKILNSDSFSIIITITFSLIAISWLFWGPIHGRYLLLNCR
jgi:hypothetical protein